MWGGLALYFVRRRHKAKHARARAEEIASHAHRRTYMVAVDPSHLAARVTPFGVGVNAPNVEVPKFGERRLPLAEGGALEEGRGMVRCGRSWEMGIRARGQATR